MSRKSFEITMDDGTKYRVSVKKKLTDISKYILGIEPVTASYTGDEIKPTVLDDGTVTLDTDYVVDYNNNIEIGTGTVIASGIGDYTNESNFNFEITGKLITDHITGIEFDYADYTGEAIEPEVYDDGTITLDTDYTVTYEDNTEIGEASVIITGIGFYTGTVTYTFDILELSIANHILGIYPTLSSYTGSAIEPEVITDGNVVLDTDYIVTYSDNIDIGEGHVTITGIGTFYGTSVVFDFDIIEAAPENMLSVINSDTSEEISADIEDDIYNYNITEAGTYNITLANNITVATSTKINISASEDVQLNLNLLRIDNSDVDDDGIVIESTGEGDITINTIGNNIIYGSDNYITEGIIITNSNITFTGDGLLGLIEAAGSPAIHSEGSVVLDNTSITISNAGKCIDAVEDITINDGDYGFSSTDDDAIVSTSGDVTVNDGSVSISTISGDGIKAKAGTVNIVGGNTTIRATGDGIRSLNLNITDGELNIYTSYEYSGVNFYKSNAVTTLINSITENGSTKTKTINYNTGGHSCIVVGNKACTYSYTTVDEESEYEPGVEYTQTADGLLSITGGTIVLDSSESGIKYNSGNNVYIIGSPGDAIKSNNDASITGGNISIRSADGGISVANNLTIISEPVIMIHTAYEGIEAGTIIIGEDDDETNGPTITVYSNDDGINASKKSFSYVYADLSEVTYTKTSVSALDASASIYSGTVKVYINDNGTHTVSLKSATGSTVNYTFKSDGDGIDCNGSFYGYGGTVYVYGACGNTSNSPIDCDQNYVISAGITMLLVGTNTMNEYPTVINQPVFTSQGGSQIIVPSGNSITITGDDIDTFTDNLPNKSSSGKYLLFTTPGMNVSTTYTASFNNGTSYSRKAQT